MNVIRTFFLIVGFLFVSLILNQVAGYFYGRSVLSIIALFIIPLISTFYPNKKIKLAAKISLIPGALILLIYYGVKLLIK